jgi:DHA1 family multidrug resistance protein-like MFS transporter
VAEDHVLIEPGLTSADAVPVPAGRSPYPAFDWRRNLAALWVAQFTAVFGFTFVIPFLPIYLRTDLGVRGDSELAFWTGLVVGASGFTLAAANPLWGMLADRFGRKQMVVRAMIGGGVVIVLMGLVQTPQQLLAARLLLGLVAGSVAASTALVVAETPATEVGRALGILSSGVAMGRTVGPLVGGILASLITLRNVFIGSGLMLVVAVLVVIFGAHESQRPKRGARGSLRSLVRSRDKTGRLLIMLILANGSVQFGYAAAQGLLVLRLLKLDPTHIQLLTGIAFAAGGLATAASASTYWRALRVTGYRIFVVAAGLALALVVGFLALAPSALLLIVGTATLSLAFGAVNPALTSMIGIEAPTLLKGTVLGFSQAATALGMALGPLATGLVAAGFGLHAGLYAAAVVAVMGTALVALFGREPVGVSPARSTLK